MLPFFLLFTFFHIPWLFLFFDDNKMTRKPRKKQKANPVGCTGEGKRRKGNIREGSRECGFIGIEPFCTTWKSKTFGWKCGSSIVGTIDKRGVMRWPLTLRFLKILKSLFDRAKL